MRALRLHGDRDLRIDDIAPPPPPGPGEVQIRPLAVALNHIDVWGWRGMAFAKRNLPLVTGAEAVAEVVSAGEGVTGWKAGDRVAPYGALTCGHCRACREGRDNLCENVGGVMGFHLDGFAQELVNIPARLLIRVPENVTTNDAACATITFSTVEHMLFDNAKLEPGETILIQAAGSGIGTVAIKEAKAIGCTVIATAGDDEKCARAKELGADHVVNYNTQNFPTVARRVTGKRGVDVVFEHVGASTWAGSLLSLRMGGRLVTCGSTSGVSAETNLMMIFQRQLRIFGSFGASMRNVADGLAKMAGGMTPVLDTVIPLERFTEGLDRLESRRVFGKIVVTL
ncbi:Alcohol dehydrogenase [Roseomonas mucosa]|uniref:NADPH:quinone oxidoreductase n=1 Tax=Roseomonas mucosa TaxID=207340 RepID=A0A1S8DAY0_9PROT|nr:MULTISPECIES: zinc-binding dehydrogenase [Roseomonas]ATR20891.1 NADPH:quinone oxidoreductase [Roseomonas sp. FDAARGOS_362]AWV22560.1 Alcohol dehydrogenase [Roseomonas mucosa]MDT8276656.1 zinc-binding dehydrogenase [Roseomonas mucosa]MDT8354310.1 zinc-binding dehydrogenase [Roseomonas mucosa]ONH84750.1 NADPH:quinone oxidoreductase [Roseomonas mucosa]